MAALTTDSRAVLKEPVPRKSWMNVEFDELARMIRSNAIQLFDVRDKHEVHSTGMIPTSVNIPLDELENAFKLQRAEFKARYGVEMPFKQDLNIVTTCYKGSRSKTAMEKLHKLGYK
ncbi:thiosulfate:glutathione sulfurtransferase-like [Watersipora subatra]|uniref:thiosulfate:glutathione sulfurtransferase-like n=1 Tax=Watersipora subatra TaxID=2589382 RepID=UPI00355BDFC7